MEIVEEKRTFSHRLFEVGVIVKGIHGVFEIISAGVVYVISGASITTIVGSILYEELSEDPNDFLANIILQHSPHLTLPQMHFAALYFFVGGIVNIVLATGLLLHRKHMFPVAKMLLGIFVFYQLYLFTRTNSPWLLLLSFYDLLLIWLIFREYRRRWPVESPTAVT